MIKTVKLSPRLEAVLSFVQGNALVDVGTDHAHLPIAACMQGIVQKGIACDLNAGPLETACKNIADYGLEGKIETRLGYGLDPISEEETDCIAIAGMGGMNIVNILQKFKFFKKINRLVVQPQRDVVLVRRTLDEMGFVFLDEVSVKEGNRFYSVIAMGGIR